MIPLQLHRFLASGFFLVILLVVDSALLQSVIGAERQARQPAAYDLELATVVLARDEDKDVEHKLGTPCLAPGPNQQSVSHLYRRNDGSYLRFGVNVAPFDVHYRLVESMTMSLKPIMDATCYTTASGGSVNDRLEGIWTGKGIKLGDSIEGVIRSYGEPNERRLSGAEVWLHYNAGYENDRY
ncbi:MAG: hypothetical protein C4293_15625, partial [Nitrospiraceae bacterium]